MSAREFPISPLLPEVLASLARHPRLVLEAPPGAGKTTQLPLALLGADWLGSQRIIMLEPRRVAARAAAGFMAAQLGEAVGERVGYRIRFERCVGPATRIEVVTEGILARMIQDDPELSGVGALVFDEFHERHLHADLGLALALDVQAQLRPELRLVVMSATLDGGRLAGFLDAPRLVSAGRSFSVETGHFPARRDEPAVQQLRRCIEHALASHEGDLLVFLPGRREVAEAERVLASAWSGGDTANAGVQVLALHGELAVEQQQRILAPDPGGARRVVLATNVAESSVTLPGVRVVIDSGLAREPRLDPASGFSRLQTVAVSQASADQRAGRAGRVAPGWCYRLWPQSTRLEPGRRPEIDQVELAGLALELAAWGSNALRFVDPPPAGALAAAVELLQRLGALEGGTITAAGRRMLALGAHPRLAAMLLASPPGDKALACDLAALIEARDPLRGGRRDDWSSRFQALHAWRQRRPVVDAHRASLTLIDQASAQWRRRLGVQRSTAGDVPAHRLGDLLAHAYPDRIARQLPADPRRYQLANGRGARLFDDSSLYGEPWLVVSELRFEERDSLIMRAAPVDERRLREGFPERFSERERVHWDSSRNGVAAVRESHFDQILLESRPLPTFDRARLAEALTDAVRQLGLDILPWTPALQQWRHRLRCVREHGDPADWPDLSDAALLDGLEQWLSPSLAGLTRLDRLDEARFAEALKSQLDWRRRERLDQLAPSRITVPSGQARAIVYQPEAGPVLAVKLQELFGLQDTPRIVEGRLALTLHLLSPAGRPLQVTQDLKGFWERTYPEVRREMKGRYPRHPWPEDPWSATATHRAKPRERKA